MYLSIETSSLVSSIALGNEKVLKGEITIQASLTHSEQLVPHINELLKMCNITKKDLKGIIVSIGPGSFTGLRIGLATAKAMAYGLRIPIVGIMTMRAMAYNAMFADRLIAVWIDAQKNNIYQALYRWYGDKLEEVASPEVKDFDEALGELVARDEDILFMGDGAYYDRDEIEQTSPLFKVAPSAIAIPRGQSLLQAGIKRLNRGEFDDLMTIVPFYLRRSEAEVLWDKKYGKVADNK